MVRRHHVALLWVARSAEKNTPDGYDEECCEVFLNLFSFCSLDKITYSSGGKYECVFLTDPEVKQTIEVKSKLMNLTKQSCFLCHF